MRRTDNVADGSQTPVVRREVSLSMNALPDCFHYPAEELPVRSPVPVLVLEDANALHAHFARAIADEIASNTAAGRVTRLILPVGPVGHYPLLAEICNLEQISWQNCHVFFMDEYCDWQGRRVPPEHPLSFRGFAQRTLFDRLDRAIALPAAQLHFPDPLQIDRISAEIDAVGGVDTCYGGIGIHGHVAFNEAPTSRWTQVTLAEFKSSKTRLLPLAAETIVMNGSRAAAGFFPALPPMAVTLGMADILAARRVQLYCQGGVWQRAILRIALFGSPRDEAVKGEDLHYPVTLLRGHGDIRIVTEQSTAQPPLPSL